MVGRDNSGEDKSTSDTLIPLPYFSNVTYDEFHALLIGVAIAYFSSVLWCAGYRDAVVVGNALFWGLVFGIRFEWNGKVVELPDNPRAQGLRTLQREFWWAFVPFALTNLTLVLEFMRCS